VSTITSAEYKQLDEVTNTASPVVNNGVIVNLSGGSRWRVVREQAVRRRGRRGDGVPTPIVPGTTHTGSIVLTVR
jgi:hypothetical protein